MFTCNLKGIEITRAAFPGQFFLFACGGRSSISDERLLEPFRSFCVGTVRWCAGIEVVAIQAVANVDASILDVRLIEISRRNRESLELVKNKGSEDGSRETLPIFCGKVLPEEISVALLQVLEQ